MVVMDGFEASGNFDGEAISQVLVVCLLSSAIFFAALRAGTVRAPRWKVDGAIEQLKAQGVEPTQDAVRRALRSSAP